jgi:signal transduction histidine kinase
MKPPPPDVGQAFERYNREVTINNFKVACILGMVLVPSFTIIDYAVYPRQARDFLMIRLACSALIGLFLAVLLTRFGRANHRLLGIILLLLPSSCISYMIYLTEGANSPYYAGLNLVLLTLGFVLRWTFPESLIAVSLVGLEYLTACVAHARFNLHGIVINNFYFFISTSIIVVTGNYFFSQLRYGEFVARFELDQSKRDLEESNRKLVELDQLKSRFFANVSHELRTPLTLLIAPLETLLHKHGKSLDAGAREMLHTMHNNGMRLLKLINDLLDVIRLESGRLELKKEPVALREFLGGLASAVRPVALNKSIVLEAEIADEVGTVLVDRDKLEKITLNLLFNSIKFTPANGKVWLRAEKRGDNLTLTVQDTGMGIAEKNLAFVFDRFWQADGSSNRKFQGVGIGLALVKELVDIQNGSVTVASEEGKGATFTVSVPFVPSDLPATSSRVGTDESPAAAVDKPAESEEWLANLYRRAELFPALAAQAEISKAPAGGDRDFRPMVLIADDEPDMRRFLHSQLEEDYEVMEAVDGLMATEKAEQFLPDIILLDLMMPHKDGLQVCKELREIPSTAGIPIILLTARADEEAKFDALQIGANDFLAKPFSSIELQARVKNLVERNHYQRRITKQNKDLTAAIEQIKETEMQLVQSEKLSSLGRLSAGIIHEINNPLNFTMTALFTLRNKARHFPQEMRPEYEEILNDIEEGLKRVRNIVSDLRTFTHPGGGPGELVDTVESTNAALRFLSGEWKDRVTIERQIPAGHVVWSNRNKLIHVLINLLQNSIDALQEKKFTAGETPTVTISGHVNGTRSYLVIRDNGPGIDPKVVDKIFDPFFTTKEIGKGMGLGLSICYRIVHGYGGNMTVQSERGSYCMFTLDFPLEYQPAQESETMNG